MSVKNDYIYVSGCSYTYGIGIETDSIPQKRWSTLLANKLNCDAVNSACPGSSNFRIARAVYHDIVTAEVLPKLIIVMWSDPPRQEFFRPQENEHPWLDLAQITPQGVGTIRSYYHKDAFESFFTFINTEERALVHTLNHMLSIEMLGRYYGVPVIHLQYKSNLNRYYRHLLLKHADGNDRTYKNLISQINSQVKFFEDTNSHVFGFSHDVSFNKIITDKKLPTSKVSLGHPEEQGHEEIAEWIYQHIVSSHDLSERLQLHLR